MQRYCKRLVSISMGFLRIWFSCRIEILLNKYNEHKSSCIQLELDVGAFIIYRSCSIASDIVLCSAQYYVAHSTMRRTIVSKIITENFAMNIQKDLN